MDEDWQADLERWLAPYLEVLGNKTRRRMCPAYIAGLIGPGDRKSIQPMAARSDAVAYDRLHHFIGAGVWDSASLEATLWQQADELVGGDGAWLIIDDTALPRKGKASVGVAPQYATALGKNANCQTLVSLTLASGEVPVMLSLRLFLPESWTSDIARMDKASVPAPLRDYRTKPEIAIEEIDRVIAAGARFGCVLADAGYPIVVLFGHDSPPGKRARLAALVPTPAGRHTGHMRIEFHLPAAHLDLSPLHRAAVLTLRHLVETGPIGLTPNYALKRYFVTWSAEAFDWPGYRPEDLYAVNKVLNEHDFPPLYALHDLLLAGKFVRRRKGFLHITELGKDLLAHPGSLWLALAQHLLATTEVGWLSILNAIDIAASVTDRDFGGDPSLVYVHVLRPLAWLGLLQEEMRVFMKSPLWGAALSFEAGTPMTRH